MMFVFGEVQDPMSETVNLVEDIVRSQIIELVSSVPHVRHHDTLCLTIDNHRFSKLGV